MSTESLMSTAKVEQRGPLLGKLEQFSSDRESWDSKLECFVLFLLCNSIADIKKFCTLLTSIGMDTYTLLRN
ncbi:hypothetical protein PR048_013056 [Dryococelus australis]|uniref:Uncharacterized protein n=1 Tax=Dryococelus australis TaxID=614101 RepID=A0ABQ9HR42_9NEOP|nr:hypothetical protein PR048_013056 [Dryococelus australis]